MIKKKKRTFIISGSVLLFIGILYGIFALIQWLTFNNLNILKGVQSSELWFEDSPYSSKDTPSLQMENDEDFHILLFSDTQLESDPIRDKTTLEMMDRLVETTDPDFIMTTGDNVSWTFAVNRTKKFIKHMEAYGIPWGVTLGNHDSEGLADRLWHGNQYEYAENSFFRSGPSNIHGIGNYSVNIENENGEIIYSLIMMDSNLRRNFGDSMDYDFIYYDQIKWYEWLIKGLDSQKEEPIPSMLFFHIPLPEFGEASAAWHEGQLPETAAFGENNEGIYSSPVNTGLFDSALRLGSTTHMFCGHDHLNNLSVDWRGIRLTYGLKTGPTAWAAEDKQGATLITIKNETSEVIVEHIYSVNGE